MFYCIEGRESNDLRRFYLRSGNCRARGGKSGDHQELVSQQDQEKQKEKIFRNTVLAQQAAGRLFVSPQFVCGEKYGIIFVYR
jgi:hypothetical protein